MILLRPNGSRAASVRVEPLTQGEPRTGNFANVGWDFDTQSSTLDGLRVLGHVAGTGDVSVNANEWIAGPMAPSRIEGVSIQWATKPRDLRYSGTPSRRPPKLALPGWLASIPLQELGDERCRSLES